MAETRTFSLDHIILMSIFIVEEEGFCESMPKIYIDSRFQNYLVSLRDTQLSSMLRSVAEKIKASLSYHHKKLNIVAKKDQSYPEMVDVCIFGEDEYVLTKERAKVDISC